MPRKPAGAPTADDVPEQWRNRILSYALVAPAELEANPGNPRLHGDSQRTAMSAVLDDVGFVAPIVVNKRTMRIIDGHMRTDLVASRGGKIPVVFVDLTDAEEAEILAVMDPIGAMATYDPEATAALIDGMATTVDLDVVLGELAASQQETEAADKPVRHSDPLYPLKRGHVLISVDLNQWDQVSDLLDQIGAIEGVDVASTVN